MSIEIFEATIGYQTIDKRSGKWNDELRSITKRFETRHQAEQYVWNFYNETRRIMWSGVRKQFPLEGFIDEVHKKRHIEP